MNQKTVTQKTTTKTSLVQFFVKNLSQNDSQNGPGSLNEFEGIAFMSQEVSKGRPRPLKTSFWNNF